MRRKFKLRNERGQHVAAVLYFYELSVNCFIGIIVDNELAKYEMGLYNDENINQLIFSDLASRLPIQYHDYIEANDYVN